jgi:citrate synthase
MNTTRYLRLIEPFWREKPFSEDEFRLLEVLYCAHRASAQRTNASSVTVANAAGGSGELSKAVAAGLLTIGGKHGPIVQTFEFLDRPDPAHYVELYLDRQQMVPGWGGTFQKDAPDPLWEETRLVLKEFYPLFIAKIDLVTAELHRLGRGIYPNPSAYTATVALALGMPAKLSPYLFIASRLDAWVQIAAQYL